MNNKNVTPERLRKITVGDYITVEKYGDLKVDKVLGSTRFGAQYYQCEYQGETVQVTPRMVTEITLFDD